MCTFFPANVWNYTQTVAALNALTKKESHWKGGALPEDALQAFQELQSYQCSASLVGYPCKHHPLCLITDAILGDEKKPGGIGAILTLTNACGIISYAS
jgi:hypothetical protein